MDDPLSLTPANNTIFEETNESIQSERDPKGNSVILAQPTANPPITPLIPFTDLPNVENPLA